MKTIMQPIMQKLGMLTAMLCIFLSASAYDFEVDSIYYNITDSAAKEVEVTYESYGSYSGAIVVPSSVTYEGENYKVTAIGEDAFFSSGLTSITIPNSVTTIGDYTFSECEDLTSIVIPNSVTTIGKEAFYWCSGLTNIEVDDENEAYMSKDGILYNKSQTTIVCCPCGKEGDIVIPNTVTSIEKSAFIGSRLTNIGVDDENEVYSSKDGILYNKTQDTLVCCPCGKAGDFIIPNGVTTIGEEAFFECRGLTSMFIPNSVTTIGKEAFAGCGGLTTITISNSLTTIGNWAFSECRGLTTITFPNTVTTIGKYAVLGCDGLRSIISLAVTPPECGFNVFGAVDKQKCTLYVPAGSLEAYKQSPEWEDFTLVAETETGIDSIEADDAAGTTEVYNLAGEKVAATPENLPAGVYIVREGLTARKIVVR